ncbi:receptor-interacting serine/threonine-protein kinase 4-like [Dreissena polymorpha]|uniref:SOCS box domain-containing protein n=1 Tax=Dreissena polymorpha TaxID=45954 RepID=A0A9D4LRY7_DREPO|nr:receptor-interacting serine/threonine-protein kinase 4-like [Dreissena polymorpha]KAH3863795.1 hypothetical protein DPMN_026795 [Dreissena polymorpha]
MTQLDNSTLTENVIQTIRWTIEYCEHHGVKESDLVTVFKNVSDKEIIDLLFIAIKLRRTNVLARCLPLVRNQLKIVLKCGKTLLDKLLCLAVEAGWLPEVRILIASGANPNARYRGSPLIHLAAVQEDTRSLQELLDAGAEMDAADDRGQKIVQNLIASQQKHKKAVLELLLKHDELCLKPSLSGKHLLHLAASHAPEVVDTLVSCGYDVNQPDVINKDTALHIACNMMCVESIACLVKHGCHFNTVNVHGEAPLAKLIQKIKSFSDFHSRSRFRLAKTLYLIGFRLKLPSVETLNDMRHKQPIHCGRNKLYDKYLEVQRTVNAVPSLQNLSRLAVRETLADGATQRPVDALYIPEHLKGFLMFRQLNISQ